MAIWSITSAQAIAHDTFCSACPFLPELTVNLYDMASKASKATTDVPRAAMSEQTLYALPYLSR